MPSRPESFAPRPSRGRAFTLVEMMCVLTILAIASALVTPLISNTADVRLSAAQRKLISDLQYAQGMAVAGRKSIYVRCVANRYDLCTLANSALTPVAHPIDPGTYVVTFGTTSKDRSMRDVAFVLPTFAFADHTLGFDATGVPFSYNDQTNVKSALSSRSTLTLGASGLTRSVYVEAFTGELRVP